MLSARINEVTNVLIDVNTNIKKKLPNRILIIVLTLKPNRKQDGKEKK